MRYYTELDYKYLDDLQCKFVKNSKGIEYLNVESSFDIETTSTNIEGRKVCCCYIWQFGIKYGKDVFYGRTFDGFINMLNLLSNYFNLNDKKIIPVYVHNFSYEFQFIRKYFEWVNVFAVDERKPIRALTSNGIEFRDSYILSGYSLENTAKNLNKYKVKKLVGDLDYSLIRHSGTPLTEKEMGYCNNDIVTVNAYIKEQIDQYGNINRVPMTNTGRVRKFVKDACYYTNKSHKKTSKSKYIKYSKIMRDLTLDNPTYLQLKRGFMGGFTHSNPYLTNKLLKNVDSIDLTSSYPTVMLSDKFPMSRGKKLKINTIKGLQEAMKKYCLIFDIKLIKPTNKIGYESYISESKCYNLENPVLANGRVFSADLLATTITDVDFKIIQSVYEWDKIAITNVTAFYKNYLPKTIIESILKLYKDKTELKGVEGSEVEYLLAKGMLNSVYGMSVTDFVKDNHVYSDSWEVEKVDSDEKITEYNKSKSRFLYYPWGIWVTAYARRNLWTAILNIGNDYIYSDTDSIKMLNYETHVKYINGYNRHVTNKLNAMMEYYNLDKSKLHPKTIQGKEKPLGVWDYEGHYSHFKTLGAKRYLYEEEGKLHLTLAGLNKQKGCQYMLELSNNDNLKVFDIFNDELYIPSEKTGKMTHTYIDYEDSFLLTDYLGNTQEVHTLSGVHLDNCEFTLSIAEQYKSFMINLGKGYIFKGQKNA